MAIKSISLAGFSAKAVETSNKYGFSELMEDFYTSNEVFTHEEEGLTFKYRYAVQFDCECDDLEDCYFSLFMVPEFESLHDNKKDSIRESCPDVEDSDFNAYDVVLEGCCLTIHYGKVADITDSEDATEFRNDVISVVNTLLPAINGMRGFVLDRYINRIGSTGWDEVRSWLEGKNFAEYALERFNN